MRVLIAGMGNDLCRDDGFGIEVLRRYARGDVPDGAHLLEAGIGGIRLVQQLMDGFDALIILDAVDRGYEPGTVCVLRVEVPIPLTGSEPPFQVDMHLTVPSSALQLAHALEVAPPLIYIIGCQPKECDLGMGLSPPVERGVAEALRRLRRLVGALRRGAPPA